MKKAVHFGAGNIGRGFIGLLLFQAGYEITFVDIAPALIDAINRHKGYTVKTMGDKHEEFKVTGIRGLVSSQKNQVAYAIARADIVTTAVGPGVLEKIASIIAQGLKLKLAKNPKQPLNIIACENMVGASELLKQKALAHLQPQEVSELKNSVGFPNAAVDRIVPPQDSSRGLLSVSVEPYFEWVTDKNAFIPPVPSIPGMKTVDNLKAYVERKIFTLNTGHAISAYLGYRKGYATIEEALEDQQIYSVVKGAMEESGKYLIHHFSFPVKEHEEYVEKTLKRFQNPSLKDEVVRVARQPIRKLGPKDRLIFPAKKALEIGIKPLNLVTGIAAALKFDWQGDDEAGALQAMIKKEGIQEVLTRICNISEESILLKMIIDAFDKMP
jgi:mannitol-1-phosphate 5-dehydrogenase